DRRSAMLLAKKNQLRICVQAEELGEQASRHLLVNLQDIPGNPQRIPLATVAARRVVDPSAYAAYVDRPSPTIDHI
ncbi:hypothetical protein AB0G02_26895, partial [Actinosynnema sp. NPDC023658]|uniref:hypothetical protein n=1 Tax=Actinosynnema sp. NPDC023658 TaxID=3155465 RepID=UPI00340C0F81